MSKYNVYAKRLDEAFKKARKEYQDLVDSRDKAKKADEMAGHLSAESYNGEKEAKKAIARAHLREAEDRLRIEGRRIWDEFEAAKVKIGAELQAAIKQDNLATPDAVDANGLELLKSGIMTADDMEGFLDRYNNNPTMLKLLAKYSRDAAGMAEDAAERRRLNAVYHAAKDGTGSIIQKWNDLAGVSKYCSGRAHGKDFTMGISSNYVVNMSNKWDELCAEAIERF